jgi:hypothetical protein
MECAQGEERRVHLLDVREERRAPWRLGAGHCVAEMTDKLSCTSNRRCRRLHGDHVGLSWMRATRGDVYYEAVEAISGKLLRRAQLSPTSSA